MNRLLATLTGGWLALALLAPASGALALGYGPQKNGPMSDSGGTGGSITILSPENGATLTDGTGIVLSYNVTLGPNGNHLHVYVDNNNPIISHDVTRCPCKVPLPDLAPGKHTVAVKEATSSHALTGIESSVTFTVQ